MLPTFQHKAWESRRFLYWLHLIAWWRMQPLLHPASLCDLGLSCFPLFLQLFSNNDRSAALLYWRETKMCRMPSVPPLHRPSWRTKWMIQFTRYVFLGTQCKKGSRSWCCFVFFSSTVAVFTLTAWNLKTKQCNPEFKYLLQSLICLN